MKKHLLLILISFLLLSSCSQLAFRSLMQIKKGSSLSDVESFTLNDQFVQSIDHYDNDTYDISSEMKTSAKRPVHVIVKKLYHAQSNQYFVFAFEDEKLVYWGYPIDFEKTREPFLQKIGDLSNGIIDVLEGKSAG
jgi:hypothetical protein